MDKFSYALECDEWWEDYQFYGKMTNSLYSRAKKLIEIGEDLN